MDMGWIAAAITALAGLIGLFFGKAYWATLNKLISQQSEEIARLHIEMESVRRENSLLRTRIDDIEKLYYTAIREKDITQGLLDTYVATCQDLKNDNTRLRGENEKLRYRLDELNPLPSPQPPTTDTP